MEAERLVTQSSPDHFLEPDEGATAKEENVSRVNREELLVRVLATTLRRHVRNSAFEDLQQGLLHAFTRNIARDRRVLILTTNLIDLVDVDDALLCALDIAVRSLQKFENDILDVFTDVARFSQRRRIDDRKRHREHTRERLRQQRLTGSGRTDQKNVGLLDLDIRTTASKLDALVVLIDSNGETLLRLFLADHIFI